MADLKHYFINPKTGRGFDELTDINREILSMENIKEGSFAQVTFKMFNADGSSYDYRADDLGLSASNSLTGVSSGNIVQENSVTNVSVNKNAARIKDIKNFAGKIGLIQMGKTMVNYAISSYGNWTQDPLAQAEIDNIRTSVQPLSNIGMGAAVGGWIGAVAAAVAETGSLIMDAIDTNINLKRQGIQSKINQRRLGINPLNSGGR